VPASFQDCVKSPSVGFVLVLDFSGIFEDEDENEDENDGAVGDFSHSLFRRRLLIYRRSARISSFCFARSARAVGPSAAVVALRLDGR